MMIVNEELGHVLVVHIFIAVFKNLDYLLQNFEQLIKTPKKL